MSSISQERSYSYRQQSNPNVSCLVEPFSFIKEYKLKVTPIPGETICRDCFYEDFTNFEKIIEHYFWIQEGIHDEIPWKCLVKIDDGITRGTYAYFEAGCDYTGFDCQGWMKVWVSHNYNSLIKFAMDESTYIEYIKQTTPLKLKVCGNCNFYGLPCDNCKYFYNIGK